MTVSEELENCINNTLAPKFVAMQSIQFDGKGLPSRKNHDYFYNSRNKHISCDDITDTTYRNL